MDSLSELIGKSPAVEELRAKVYRLLQHQQTVGHFPPILIHGETGTGKGLVAKLIHRAGPRANGPFQQVNCAAIPETLLESELFGFERGAFTDARRSKRGLFQSAHHGVLFLDEVGLLSEALQAKLLTVIEERRVRPLGRTDSEEIDVWIVTATNKDLRGEVQQGRFREDLYHRLAVLALRVPALRERREDIRLLAEHFLALARREFSLPEKRLTGDACEALLAYPWSGNIRELSNVMERVALLSEGNEITPAMLQLGTGGRGVLPEAREAPPVEEEVMSLARKRIVDALTKTDWNISAAADVLRMTRNKLRYRIQKYGLTSASRSAAKGIPRSAVAGSSTTAAARGAASKDIPWERRRLTLLRADVAVTDPRESALHAQTAVTLFAEKVESFGGRVERTTPESVIAVFGLEPTEDAPQRAVHAAMAIQSAAARSEPIAGARLRTKLAIDVAEVLVRDGADGPETDLGSRRDALTVCELLIGEAEPGEIVVSPPAARVLERRFHLVVPARAAQSNLLSGFRLVSRKRSGLGIGGQITPFVGRENDREFVKSRVAAMVRGHGHALGIVGEAGIGKSRLLRELSPALRGQSLTVLRGRCLSYGRSIPYFLVVDILRETLRVSERDDHRKITERVLGALEALRIDRAQAGYLLQLLGVREGTERLATLSDEAIKTGTLDVLRQMLVSGSRLRPIVVLAEDLHWIDKASEDLLALMVEHLAGTRILLVTTYRPGWRPPWADRSYVTQIALQPLSSEDSLAVVRAVGAGAELPEVAARAIVDKGEGNPFFLEEMARVGWDDAGDGVSVAIPDTIQDVIRARIERLPEPTRRFLCTASVLGREFLPALAATLAEVSPEPYLAELVELEFLQAQSRAGEQVYMFRHALMHDVAYELLAVTERCRLHAAAAAAVGAHYAGRLAEVDERLAYHYSRADDHPNAVDYLTRCAERAVRSYAHEEAVRALRQALAHLSQLPAAGNPERRFELTLRLASSLIPLGRLQQALDLLLQHQERLDPVDHGAITGRYYFLVGRAFSFLGDYERAAEAAQRAIAEATLSGDAATTGKAYSVLAMDAPMSGRAAQGIDYARRAIGLLDGTQERWWLGHTLWVLGLNYSQTGDFVAALEAEGKAYAIGEALSDSRLQTYASWVTGLIYAAIGEAETGIEACQRALERAPDPLNRAIARGFLGYTHLENGNPAEAIPLLEVAKRHLAEFRYRPFQGWFAVFQAEALRLERKLERAVELATEGLVISREAGFTIGVGWAQQVLGRIAHQRGSVGDAASYLSQARQTFTEIQSRYELGRTFMDLALVARSAGDRPGMASHLLSAHRVFVTLHVPRYIERVSVLAREAGVAIPSRV